MKSDNLTGSSSRVIRVQIKNLRPADSIIVRESGDSSYFSYRRSTSAMVHITTEALARMQADLTRDYESAGFLLGKRIPEKRQKFLFPYYAVGHGLQRNSVEVIHDEKVLARQLLKFREKGFDSVIDLHNHPYEKEEIALRIPKYLQDIPLPALIRRGLFERIKEEGDFSDDDEKFDGAWNSAAARMGFARYFFGVYLTLHVGTNGGRLNMLMVHDGRNMKDVPIEVVENGNGSGIGRLPIRFLRGLEDVEFGIQRLARGG